MSRSGYDDEGGDYANLWRGRVNSAINGKRGQAFLNELAAAMDAMPVKELIQEELIDATGGVCAIGVVCKARGLDVEYVDQYDPPTVGKLVGIASAMAAEIEWVNDEASPYTQQADGKWSRRETPAARWIRVRKWVEEHIKPTPSGAACI